MLRALAFVAVGQQQHQARQQVPLVFAGAHKLIDHRLRHVGEIAKLRFPQHQRLGIIAAVAVFESHHARFRKRRVVDVARGLARRNVAQRNIFRLILDIDQHRVPLIEGRAPRVLPAEAHRNPRFPCLTRLANASASAMP